eukprot:3860766-Prymnesium_polylepis.1
MSIFGPRLEYVFWNTNTGRILSSGGSYRRHGCVDSLSHDEPPWTSVTSQEPQQTQADAASQRRRPIHAVPRP